MQLGEARQVLGQKSRTWTVDKNEALLRSLDTDGDGKVDIKEFIDGFLAKSPEESGEFLSLVSDLHAVARYISGRHIAELTKQA